MPDTIHMKDGRSYSGTAEVKGEVVVITSYGNRTIVPLNDVKEIIQHLSETNNRCSDQAYSSSTNLHHFGGIIWLNS